MILSLVLISALFVIAVIVAYGLWHKKSMWPWTAIYWTVLAIKILADYAIDRW